MPFIRQVIDILLFRSGPQDIAGTQSTVILAASAYFLVQAFQSMLIISTGQALFQAAVTTAVLAAYASTLLKWRGYHNRIPQTLVALYSTGAALALLLSAVMPAIEPFLQAAEQANSLTEVGQPPTVAVLSMIVLGLWGVAVSAHIYRHALQTKFWQGLLAILGFDVAIFVVFSILGGMG